MIIQVDREGSFAGLGRAVGKVLAVGGVKSLVILSCDGNGLGPAQMDPLLGELPVPVCGGIFPAVISGRRRLERGTVVVGLGCEAAVATFPDIGGKETDHVELIDEEFPGDGEVKTMLVFVDGLAPRIESFVGSLFTVFGLAPNYVGGGTGSLSMRRRPCLFTNGGMVMDAAVVALLDAESGVGVSHGWRSVSGPFRVTESDGNLVKTIDWEPAFDVYRSVVDRHAGRAIQKENFFELAKAFPFGLTRLDAERVVRDPIRLNPDKSMVCVGEMPEGAFVDILNGDADSLIEAAGNARRLGEAAFPEGRGPGLSFFVDCISRVLFLGERFDEELAAVCGEGAPMVGACTIGEIANSGTDFLEFYNKTAVVAFLEAR